MPSSSRIGLAPILLSLLVLGPLTYSSVSAQTKTSFVLVFVPMVWSGSLNVFVRAADEGANFFIRTSGIGRYADVQIVKIRDVMQASLTDITLPDQVVAFGVRRAPGDRYIGLTDGDLAPRGQRAVSGWTRMFARGLVSENETVTMAHELSHTFGLCDEYDVGAWGGDNGRRPCPNPYPTACPRFPGVGCPGNPRPDGGYCIMGSTRRTLQRGFDPACYNALQREFVRLFGEPGEPPPPTPTPLPRATPIPRPVISRLAFESDRDGHFEIYTGADDGSGIVRVTFSIGNAYQPPWSPDEL